MIFYDGVKPPDKIILGSDIQIEDLNKLFVIDNMKRKYKKNPGEWLNYVVGRNNVNCITCENYLKCTCPDEISQHEMM